jgi:E-phenylitaconyl-CoA hydratase
MTIIYEVEDEIATITLNRPEAMNAMNHETYEEISNAFLMIENDDAVRVGIVTGAGNRAFSAGADLKEMHTGASDGDHWVPWKPSRWDFGLSTSKPLIAAVNGYALAGGLELALVCDIRICSPNAMFGTPEVKWNLLDGYGAYKLPRIVGLSVAMEMLLTGEFIDASEALRVGLINRIVPSDDLLKEARIIAERIVGNGPMAVRMTKELVERGLSRSLTDHFRVMHEYYDRVDRTSDQAEGLQAFVERRKPEY